VVAPPLRDELNVRLGHHAACCVRLVTDMVFRDRVAAGAGLVADVLLGYHPTRRVRDLADALLGHLVAASAGLVADVCFRHDAADCPRTRPILAVRHLSADRYLHRRADWLADVTALLDDAALHVRHPHLLAHCLAGALHTLLDDRARAVAA